MQPLLRRARHEDAPHIINAHVRSIRETCSKDYNSEQIEAWAGKNFRVDLWQKTIDQDLVWVVGIDSSVKGFGHLAIHDKNAEVMGLYFAPEVQGLGAGKKLFELMKQEAHARGVSTFKLHSTVTAKSFYESLGFRQTEGSCSIDIQGVAITCFPMSYSMS